MLNVHSVSKLIGGYIVLGMYYVFFCTKSGIPTLYLDCTFSFMLYNTVSTLFRSKQDSYQFYQFLSKESEIV